MTISKLGRKFTTAIASLWLIINLSACGSTHESTEEDRIMTVAILKADYGFTGADFVEDVNKTFADDYTVYQVSFMSCTAEIKYDSNGDLSYLNEKKYEKSIEKLSRDRKKRGTGEELDVNVNDFVVHSEYFKEYLVDLGAIECDRT